MYKVKAENGLTVTNYVFKKGAKFSRDEWKWGENALNAALKSEKCELVKSEKEDEKKSNSSVKSGISKKEKELEKLLKKYSELDPEDEEAEKLLEEITKLEEEIK